MTLPARKFSWSAPGAAARGGLAFAVLFVALGLLLPSLSAHPPGPTAPGRAQIGSTVAQMGSHGPLVPRHMAASATGELAPPISRHFTGSARLNGPVVNAPTERDYPPPMSVPSLASPVPVFVDTVAARGATPLALGTGPGFDGMNFTECSCTPPDVQVGASPRQVVELVNSAIEVWSTSGAYISAEYLYSLFNLSSSEFISDPKVIYDADSGRWLVSTFACTVVSSSCSTTIVPLAISKTSDATGWWWIYTSFAPSPAGIPDQPILGVSHDLLSMSANDFSGGGYAGAEFWLVNKSAAVNGTAPSYARYGPYSFEESIHPVRTLQPADGLFLVETYPGAPGAIDLFSASQVPPATTSVSSYNLTVGPLTGPPAARQPGTTDTLDGGSGLTVRVSDALWSKGRLWATFSDKCSVGTSNQSCVRLVELNTTSTPTVYQDFDVAVRSADVYYGAVSLDPGGDLVLNYGVSSSAIYPSTWATFQGANDPLGTVRPAIPMRNGSASQSCGGTCRFGDYFGSAPEPGSSLVWTGGEYVTSSTAWQTWIQAVRALGPMSVTAAASPGTLDAGQNVSVQVSVANSTCPPGGVQRCSLVVPFGDSTTSWTNCTFLGSTVTVTHDYRTTGSYHAGQGGNVTVYPSSSCTPGTATGTFPLGSTLVLVLPDPAVTVAATPSAAADAGQTLQFTASPTGGATPYAFVWSGLPAGCLSNDSPVIFCTPASSGTYFVDVQVTDQLGVSTTTQLTLFIDARPAALLNASAARVDVGQTVTWTAFASLGSGSFSYLWVGLPSDCQPANASQIACAPTHSGTYKVSVDVFDSRGVPGASLPLTLQVAPALTVVVQGPGASVGAGSPVDLAANASGGTSPLTYVWSGLPSGCTGASSSVVSCQPSAGSYTVHVTVHDSTGASATASYQLVVAAGNPLTSVGTTGFAVLLVGILVIVLAAVLAVLLLRRRGPARPPAT